MNGRGTRAVLWLVAVSVWQVHLTAVTADDAPAGAYDVGPAAYGAEAAYVMDPGMYPSDVVVYEGDHGGIPKGRLMRACYAVKCCLHSSYANPNYFDEYLCGCLSTVGGCFGLPPLATRKLQGWSHARPMPLGGTYNMAYPLNPDYADPRDAGVSAAQGYGVPVASPIAPQAEFQYNYSWGAPASRITPLSRPLPPR